MSSAFCVRERTSASPDRSLSVSWSEAEGTRSSNSPPVAPPLPVVTVEWRTKPWRRSTTDTIWFATSSSFAPGAARGRAAERSTRRTRVSGVAGAVWAVTPLEGAARDSAEAFGAATAGAPPVLVLSPQPPESETPITTATITAVPAAMAGSGELGSRSFDFRGNPAANRSSMRCSNAALGRGVSARSAISSSCSSVVIAGLSQFLECTVKAGAGVRLGDVQHLPDLRVAEPAGELERDDLPLPPVERRERGADRLALQGELRVLRGRGGGDVLQIRLKTGPALAPPQLVERGISSDAEDPRLG